MEHHHALPVDKLMVLSTTEYTSEPKLLTTLSTCRNRPINNKIITTTTKQQQTNKQVYMYLFIYTLIHMHVCMGK